VAPAHLRIIDRPIQLCDRGLQASPAPLVFRLCRLRIHELPRGCILQLIRLRASSKLPWRPGCPGTRVAPGSALFSCAGDGSASCLASRILWRCRRWSSRVAPPLRSSNCASPCFHRVAPAFTRSGFPAMALRVAPRFPSFQRCRWEGSSGRPASSLRLPRLSVFPPGRPGFRTLRWCQRWSPGLPRFSHPSALPVLEFASCPAAPLFQPRLPTLPPGRPGFHVFWRCRGESFQVAPNTASLSLAASASPDCSGSCIGGWVDDESPAGSNFASSACAADESSRPFRSCTSLPESQCRFNLVWSTHYRTNRPQIDSLKTASCISAPGWN